MIMRMYENDWLHFFHHSFISFHIGLNLIERFYRKRIVCLLTDKQICGLDTSFSKTT